MLFCVLRVLYTVVLLFHLEREGHPAICNTMDGPGGQNAK